MDSYCPSSKKDWRNWLKKNHLIEDSIWLIIHKKGSPTPNLNWSEAVDEALCFGWIDSTKKTIDKEKYKQYFSKRRPKSTWSKVNKDKVKTLIEQDLMHEEGYKSIKIAKENGSWTMLDQVEALVIPEDLKEEFAKHKGSIEYFESLSKSAKKILLYWVISAKRTETRQKRILEIAVNASKNLKPKQFR
ncbi:YdeI/OmpD-associated family protein [Aureispira anguillae]|uniref:YdeI/OmpD-associated family protein n=1 Tax=Aureispira anguillae TaxID=2864201 RepID=A0A915YEI7_9BACT|nr:YdeI/OmpD-associated family protein [Aureispira anguillae]BDS11536.1 YdeI/OmpD-associated family protein [Aureispira anguillae]